MFSFVAEVERCSSRTLVSTEAQRKVQQGWQLLLALGAGAGRQLQVGQ